MLLRAAVGAALVFGLIAILASGVSVLIVIQMRRTEAALAALIASVSAEQAGKHENHASRLNSIESHAQTVADILVNQRAFNDHQALLNSAVSERIARYDTLLCVEPNVPAVKIH